MSDVQTSNMQMGEVRSEEVKSDLRGRAAPREVRFGAMGKIAGAVAVIILISAVGTYVHETQPAPRPSAPQHVSLNQLPQLPANPPAQQAPTPQ